jgi:hypothetical protein
MTDLVYIALVAAFFVACYALAGLFARLLKV